MIKLLIIKIIINNTLILILSYILVFFFSFYYKKPKAITKRLGNTGSIACYVGQIRGYLVPKRDPQSIITNKNHK